MRKTMAAALFLAASLFAVLGASAPQTPPAPAAKPGAFTIDLTALELGPVFEGLGALSAGASSRLLFDYPEPARSQILDLLFKPRFGASLQHLKVEIGGDVNSTDGTEPSFAHTREEFDHPQPAYYERGYEYRLMKEARRRNPAIRLDALEWGAPGWIGNGEFFSRDNADYVVRFLEMAKQAHGVDVDYVGVWNERAWAYERPRNDGWIKLLKSELKKHGLPAKIVASDEVAAWSVAEDMLKDPALLEAVDILGNHYQSGNPKGFNFELLQKTGKPVWSSEDGPWRGDWEGAKKLARRFNRNFIDYGMTKTIFWSLVTSYSDILPIPGSGIMRAATPWSGNYEVQPALWAVAHFTQFAEPGWRYIKSGCGLTPDGSSSFTTLLAPDGKEMSLIVETGEAKADQAIGLALAPAFAGRDFFIWKSDAAKSFVKVGLVKPKNGRIDIVLSKDAIFSLTTTTGQRKGDEGLAPLNPSAFPVPYEDDFEGYAAEALPRYTQDQAGVFEVQPQGGGMALKQVIPAVGIEWHFHLNSEPVTLIGDPDMTDYEAAVDVMLESPRQTATIYGRISKVIQHQIQPPMGYWLRVGTDGRWTLGKNMDLLLLDKIDIDKTWPALRYSFSDHTKNARVFPYAEIMTLDKSILEALPGVAAFLAADKDPKTLNLAVHFDGSFYLYRDYVLASGTCAFKPGVWNTLRIRCRGDRISAYVNETPTGIVTDSTYPRGPAGFGCGWHTAWFDNLSIKL
jgi:O-glycosyl hydrolase